MQSQHQLSDQLTDRSSFTSKFFESSAVIQNNEVDLKFPLPEISKVTELESFFKNNPEFKAGLMHIIDSLYAWLEKKGSSKLVEVSKKIETFKNEYIKYEGTNVELNATLIHFYRYGTQLLYQIRNLIEDEANIPLNISKTRIENLFLDFAVCGPGALLHVHDTHSDLCSVNSDVPTLFKNIRTKFAKNILQQFINDLQNKPNQAPLFDIYEQGLIIHYISETINFYAKDYGLFNVENEDPYIGNLIPAKLEFLKMYFVKLWDANFLAYFLDEIEYKNFENLTNPTNTNNLMKYLNQFGDDEVFRKNSLYDQDALADDSFKLVFYAKDLLWASIIKRLQNSGYLKCDEVTVELFDKTFIRSNNYQLSYFYEAKTRIPFYAFAYETLFYKPETSSDKIREEIKSYLLLPTQCNFKESLLTGYCNLTNTLKPILSDEEADRLVSLIIELKCENWRALLLNLPIACMPHYLKNDNDILNAAAQELTIVAQLSPDKRQFILERMLAKNLINLRTMAFNLHFTDFELLYKSINPETVKELLADHNILLEIINHYGLYSVVLLQDCYADYLISASLNSTNINFATMTTEKKILVLNLLNFKNVNKVLSVARGELRFIFNFANPSYVLNIIAKCDQAIIHAEFGQPWFIMDIVLDVKRQDLICAVISKLGADWLRNQLLNYFRILNDVKKTDTKTQLVIFVSHLIHMRLVDHSCYLEMLNLALDKNGLNFMSNLESIKKVITSITYNNFANYDIKKTIIHRILTLIGFDRLFSFARTFDQGLEVITMANEVSPSFALDALRVMKEKEFKSFKAPNMETMIKKIEMMVSDKNLQMQILDMVIKKFSKEINQKLIEHICQSGLITEDTMPTLISSLGEDNFANCIQDVTKFFRSLTTNQSFYISRLIPLLQQNLKPCDLTYALEKLSFTDFIELLNSVGLDFLVSKIDNINSLYKSVDLFFEAIHNEKLTYTQFAAMGEHFAKTGIVDILVILYFLNRLQRVNSSYSKSFLESFGFERVAELLSHERLHHRTAYKNRIIEVCKLNSDETSKLDKQSVKEETQQAQVTSKRKNEGDSEERESMEKRENKVQKTSDDSINVINVQKSDDINAQKISMTQMTLFGSATDAPLQEERNDPNPNELSANTNAGKPSIN